MSFQGRALQHGLALGVGHVHGRAYARRGLVVSSPLNGPFQNAPSFYTNPDGAIRFLDDFAGANFWHTTNQPYDGWRLTAIQGTNTLSCADSHLTLVSGANSGDGDSIYWHNSLFLSPSDAKLWFAARLKIDLVTTNFRVGVATPTISGLGAQLYGIYFNHSYSGGDQHWSVYNEDNTSETTASAGTVPAADTYIQVGFVADAASVKFYVDGELVATLTENIPQNAMAPFFAMTTALDASHVMYVDYIQGIQLR